MSNKLKNNAEILNPCLKEQELTYKCYNENNYDKSACYLQIENYKVCKEFWSFVQNTRRSQGIRPLLPPIEEREQIKKEYLGKFHKSNLS